MIIRLNSFIGKMRLKELEAETYQKFSYFFCVSITDWSLFWNLEKNGKGIKF